MLSLIKTDLKRILKDKLLIVIGILCIVFAVSTPLLLFAVSGMSEDAAQMLGMSIDAKTLFFQSFNPANDFGLIGGILLCVILCKDFSQGTVRNKIICGKTRNQIYLANFISCVIVLCSLMVIYAFITLGVSLIFFDYQATAFTANDFGYAVVSLVFKILTFVVVSALITALSVSMKNAGLCMVMYIAVTMVFSIVGTAFMMVQPFVSDNVFLETLLEIVVKCNVFATTVVGNGVTYSVLDVVYIVVSNVVFGVLFYVLGMMIFSKKDLK